MSKQLPATNTAAQTATKNKNKTTRNQKNKSRTTRIHAFDPHTVCKHKHTHTHIYIHAQVYNTLRSNMSST